LRKAVIDEPMAAMFPFRPRIGEVDVQGFDGVRRKQVFEEVGGFNSHAAQVGQFRAARFALHFTDAAQQTLDADEIVFGPAFCEIDQECAVTTAEFHFQRLVHREELR
jgi:hypothetical protein